MNATDITERRGQLPELIKQFAENSDRLLSYGTWFFSDWSSRGLFHFQERINGRWRTSTLVGYWLHPAFFGVHEDAGFCAVHQGFWTAYVRRLVRQPYSVYRAEIEAACQQEGGCYRSVPPWKGHRDAPHVLIRPVTSAA